MENAQYGVGYCNKYFYKCRNGEFVLSQCPEWETFDAALGRCANKCDICGCGGRDERCFPGEVIAEGNCLETYLKCIAPYRLERRQCSSVCDFDGLDDFDGK